VKLKIFAYWCHDLAAVQVKDRFEKKYALSRVDREEARSLEERISNRSEMSFYFLFDITFDMFVVRRNPDDANPLSSSRSAIECTRIMV